MELISIFGSCRQLCIEDYVPTTFLMNALNYPHYTKEILQEIKYLKTRHMSDNDANVCFRSGLLGQPMSNEKYNYLKAQFNESTFFLVEISSRKSYNWNPCKNKNYYMHHIATKEEYGFYDRANIIVRDLSDEEIEEDIIQIRNELYPRPLIIISHFSTYNHGKRYELIQLLDRVCKNYNIPFINQSDIVRDNPHLLVNEPILTHYTDEGNAYVGNILFQKIKEVRHVLNVQKTLTQVYYTSEAKVKKHTFHGFGDYLRGTMYLYQFLQDKDIELKVNFSNHPMRNVFVCNNHLSIEESENIQYVFGDENPLDYNHIFTNRFLLYEPISEDCRQFIIKNCLTPRISFENKMSAFRTRLGINDGEYSVIHIRTSDDDFYNENLFQNIMFIIKNIQSQNPNEKMVLMASSNLYLDKINASPYLIKTNLKRGHVGLNTTTDDECMDTMMEFMLLRSCKEIHQLSVYWWGSGFSDMVCKIFNNPIKKYRISNNFLIPKQNESKIKPVFYLPMNFVD